jgi:hypothetical protein
MELFGRPETAFLPLRIYLCLRTLVVCIVSIGIVDSLNGRLIDQAGQVGYDMVSLQVVCSVIGLLDALINDIMPRRFHMNWARGYRHIGYIGLAIANCAYLLIMAKAGTMTLLALSYGVDAAFAVLVAVGTVVRNQNSRKYPAIDRRKARL